MSWHSTGPDSSFFFFSCSGAPRDLHSFPTRRSSDLPPSGLQAMAPAPGTKNSRISPVPSMLQTTIGRIVKRSEEHTSELQSRFDLVCRLLLEKKKKQSTNQPSMIQGAKHTTLLPDST